MDAWSHRPSRLERVVETAEADDPFGALKAWLSGKSPGRLQHTRFKWSVSAHELAEAERLSASIANQATVHLVTRLYFSPSRAY